MSAQPDNVVALPQRDSPVCDPTTGEVIPPYDVQQRVNAMADELKALTTALGSAHRLNASLRTQLTNAREEQAEQACEDPDEIRALVRWHYGRFGRKKRTVPLSGMDAQIVIWLMQRADFTARDVALMSVGFAANDWYREKGMVALMNCCTSKVDGKRVRDEEKAWRFREAGAQIKGEQA